MTTNKTIDGVSRDKLRDLLNRMGQDQVSLGVYGDELRALLDAPACNTCCDQGEIFVSRGKVESHMLTEPDPIYRECPDCKPASQPQPVAVLLPERAPNDELDEAWDCGFNACLDEVARMNGIEP